MENERTLSSLLDMIAKDQLSELEAERLLNAWTRAQSGVPTGLSRQGNGRIAGTSISSSPTDSRLS